MESFLNNYRNFTRLVMFDLKTVLLAFPFSLIPIILLSFIRQFNQKQFLFISLILVYIIVLGSAYIFSFLNERDTVRNRILSLTAISFLLVSFLVLNIDRSRSFYLLKWVAVEPDGVSLEQLQRIHDLTPSDTEAISQRLTEQRQSHTIHESNGVFRVTFVGHIIFKVSNYFARFLNLHGFLDA